ncbi:MAG: PD-(D/E)XK nuclease family protein [Lachnospiraceae bacterium]|nr:PD-(D/E)XK nuclease family protein [Lachnospiraceae bacterium]
MLRFILGASGVGKTRHIYEEIIRESIDNMDKNYILLVPDQFTMETQKDIVVKHPRHGVMNIDILSFGRLAFRVFEELGINRLSILDDTGKTLLLRHAIEANKDKLKLFYDKHKYFGFVEEMKSSISELYQYGITPEQLDKVIEDTKDHKATSMKLHDIKVVYEAFQKEVASINDGENTYITKEEVLSKLCEVIGDSKIVKDSIIYMDGFTGFTPVQNRLLSLLLECADSVNIALTLPKEECENLTEVGFKEIKEHELFAMSKETINTLMSMASDRHICTEKPVIIGKTEESRFGRKEVLGHIEENIFRYEAAEKINVDDSFEIFVAENSMEETSFIAEKISELVRESKGSLRYRDIGVVTGDLEGMKRNVEKAFKRADIPFFMDNKRTLITNPFVNIIRSILRIADENFSYESVFSYIKNYMSPITDEEGDILENYVIGCGIKGKTTYTNSFKKKYRGLSDEEFEQCEGIRIKLMEALSDFTDRDFATMSVKEISDAIKAFVQKHELEEALNNSKEQFEAAGKHSLAAEYGQAYKLVMELLDKLSNLLGEEKISLKEYRRLLDDGFDEIKVGIIPLVMDQVVIGDIQRTRLNHIKVLFVAGVNDGIIPARNGKPGLLSGSDRTILKNLDLELSPTVREQAFIERFYLYLNLTKASDKLIMTYSTSSSDGSPLRPSYLIGTLRDMFNDCGIYSAKSSMKDKILSAQGAFDRMAGAITSYGSDDIDDLWRELYTYFAKDEKYRDALNRAIEGAFFMNNNLALDRTVASALYKEGVGSSITRIEKYAACAYAHFLSYGLKLAEREVYEIKPVDMGNIFHEAIELFSRKLIEKDMDLNNVTDNDRKVIVDEVVNIVAGNYGENVLTSSARNSYMIEKIRRITDRSAWAMLEHIKRGDFEPSEFELKLREGRIDRVDKMSKDSDIYIKIIDYKSGSTSFDPALVDNGLQLQLIYYMDKMVEREKKANPSKNVVPAGAFYFNIKDPVLDFEESFLDEDALASSLLKEYQMSGAINSSETVIVGIDNDIVDAKGASLITKAKYSDSGIDMRVEKKAGVMSLDNFDKLIERVKCKVSDMTKEIMDGKIDINPYKRGQLTPCTYCKYSRICAFDNKQFDNEYRSLSGTDLKYINEKWNVVKTPEEGKED